MATRFFSAVDAVRAGRPQDAVDHLAGPFEPDNEKAVADLFGLFNTAAVLAGRALRKACAHPDDPSPFDGTAVLQIVDARSGLPGHPDDLPLVDRIAIWAAAAGANLDIETVSSHCVNLYRRGTESALVDGVVLLTRLAAACPGGGDYALA